MHEKPKKITKCTKRAAQDSKKRLLPIIAVGYSAGGIEAAELFLSAMPSNSNAAFVVITHLDPSHGSMMPAVLDNFTQMQVLTIKEGISIQPNIVYVIPPNNNVTIQHNQLHLVERDKIHRDANPIDVFLKSLAQDKKENAIAVILSGTGSDGTCGINAIKKEGGIVLVQDPLSAKYDGMPHAAINTGLADYILSPEKMPEQITKWLNHTLSLNSKQSPEVQQLFLLLRTHTGHDFSDYKLNTILRRIDRRMQAQHIDKLEKYIDFVHSNPLELKKLFQDFLIGVTRFFRDPDAFGFLKKSIVSYFLKHKSAGYSMRIWVPGCSTGEEVYSIAMILCECMDEIKNPVNVQIFGTDIDSVALDVARKGIYTTDILADVSEERLNRFFVKEKNYYKINKEIRKMIVFSVQNIIKDPPFTKLDLICCRNLLIYFNIPLQKKIFPIFHYSLKPKGLLFLGLSETTPDNIDLFRLVCKKWKIFERTEAVSATNTLQQFITKFHMNELINMPTYHGVHNAPSGNANQQIKDWLIKDYVMPCLIINRQGHILYMHEKMHRYFNFGQEKNNYSINDIIIPILKKKLIAGIKNASLMHKDITYRNVNIKSETATQSINIKIISNIDVNAANGLLLVTLENTMPVKLVKSIQEKYNTPASLSKRIISLEQELQTSKEDLQSSIEELQSSNEELQSTNEELQSTNEEIETSKEELQSLNEELVLVNAELEERINLQASINDDVSNLFDSTDIATIFLDMDLCVKRFTPKSRVFIPLIPSDIGRPIHHFAINLKYDHLFEDIKVVTKNATPLSHQVQGTNNQWYLLHLLPYKTLSGVIAGVIMTFTDITEHVEAEKKLKQINQALQRSLDYTKNILESLYKPLLILDNQFKIVSINQSYYDFFHVTAEDIINKSFYEINDSQWNIVELHQFLDKIMQDDYAHREISIEKNFKHIGYKKLVLNATRISSKELSSDVLVIVIKEDI